MGLSLRFNHTNPVSVLSMNKWSTVKRASPSTLDHYLSVHVFAVDHVTFVNDHVTYIRCIRPNELKSPDQFQADKVLVQLRYTGVLETTRIRKEVGGSVV